jgi:ABC-type cobalamin/Fe3+-siderophores transport system ATPase subunit
MIDLRSENLSLAYDQEEVIHDLSLAIPNERITALVGPNGSGKSTLLRGLARLMKPERGAVYLDGQAIHQLPTRQVARQLAVLPQRPEAPDGLTVRELVAFGRFPYQGFLSAASDDDEEEIESALSITGIDQFAGRLLGELSGGQRQLAWIAMALAQGTQILLLDEPTTFLDMAHQLDVLDVLARLHREQRRTIVLVLHDINQAARYAQHMVALVAGRIVASGSPREIVTTRILADVFKIEAQVATAGVTESPFCIPLRRCR